MVSNHTRTKWVGEIIGSSHATTLLTEATFEINSHAKLIRDPRQATERKVGILSDTSLEARCLYIVRYVPLLNFTFLMYEPPSWSISTRKLLSVGAVPQSLARVAAIIKTSFICSADRFRLAVPHVLDCWNDLIIPFLPPTLTRDLLRVSSMEIAFAANSIRLQTAGDPSVFWPDERGRRDTTAGPVTH